MNSKGTVRKIDDLGRICLPSDARKILGIECGDKIEMIVDNGSIILNPYCVDDEMMGLVERMESRIDDIKNPEIRKIVGTKLMEIRLAFASDKS